MTNTISQIIQGTNSINWTVILSVITICLTAMATFIGIFKNRFISDESLRAAPLIQGIIEEVKSESKSHETLRQTINDLKVEIEKLKVESYNNTKSVEELRKDNRELVQRLDNLLKQLVDFVNS